MNATNRPVTSRLAIVAAVAAFAVAPMACEKEATAPAKVAAGNTTLGANPTVAAAVTAVPFSFPGGAGVLDASVAGQNLTVTFSGTGTTTTAAMQVGTGSITANTTFGSCVFAITQSTFPTGSKLALGQTIVVNPCNVNVNTAGQQANGVAATRSAALVLGTAVSSGQSITVSVDPGGALTLNGRSVGTITVVAVSG